MALFIILSEVSCEVSAFGKDEVAHPSAKTHGKEQPAVERHDNEHEDVAIANLNHVETTLKNVHTQTQAVVANSACVCACACVCVCVHVYATCVCRREGEVTRRHNN